MPQYYGIYLPQLEINMPGLAFSAGTADYYIEIHIAFVVPSTYIFSIFSIK
jgi:hypothetical protein